MYLPLFSFERAAIKVSTNARCDNFSIGVDGVSEYLSTIMQKFGVVGSPQAEEQRVANKMIDNLTDSHH